MKILPPPAGAAFPKYILEVKDFKEVINLRQCIQGIEVNGGRLMYEAKTMLRNGQYAYISYEPKTGEINVAHQNSFGGHSLKELKPRIRLHDTEWNPIPQSIPA